MTLQQWWRQRGGTQNPAGRRVVLWPDTFNNHFHTDVGVACVEAIEAAGWQVVMPAGPRVLRPAAVRLRLPRPGRALPPPHARRAARRDPARDAGRRHGAELPGGVQGRAHRHAPPRRRRQRAWRRTRCTSPSSSSSSRSRCRGSSARRSSGATATTRRPAAWTPSTSCSSGWASRSSPSPAGAAAWRARGDSSRATTRSRCSAASRRCCPAVREADQDTLVIANGFSCKTQIEQGDTGRRALHVAAGDEDGSRIRSGRLSGRAPGKALLPRQTRAPSGQTGEGDAGCRGSGCNCRRSRARDAFTQHVNRVLIWIRGLWGGVLLLSVIRPLRPRSGASELPVKAGAGLLAARHLVETALLATRTDPRPPRWSIGVDATHAASMLGVAAASVHLRRGALVSVVASGGLASLSLRARRKAVVGMSGPGRT